MKAKDILESRQASQLTLTVAFARRLAKVLAQLPDNTALVDLKDRKNNLFVKFWNTLSQAEKSRLGYIMRRLPTPYTRPPWLASLLGPQKKESTLTFKTAGDIRRCTHEKLYRETYLTEVQAAFISLAFGLREHKNTRKGR